MLRFLTEATCPCGPVVKALERQTGGRAGGRIECNANEWVSDAGDIVPFQIRSHKEPRPVLLSCAAMLLLSVKVLLAFYNKQLV